MLQKIYRKIVNYETMSYLICGVLTTVVDLVVFWVLYERCQMDHKVSTAVSFMAAVLFAYVVNKLIVFRNFQFKPAYLWKEWWSFFAARVFSFVVVMVLMILLVDMLGWKTLRLAGLEIGVYLAKGVTTVVNLVMNYVFSKFWIFKDR